MPAHNPPMYLELAFDLGAVDTQAAEGACWACGASALTFVDARDDAVNHPTKSGPTCEATSSPLDKTPYFVGTPVLEPAPGEFRLWPRTRLRCLFARECDAPAIARALGAALGLDPMSIEVRAVADRVWEREWLEHFHAMRFGHRLWICPRHERVSAPGAVVVALDPGLAFGTGTHPSTALCLTWLDAHLAVGARVIDYGCGREYWRWRPPSSGRARSTASISTPRRSSRRARMPQRTASLGRCRSTSTPARCRPRPTWCSRTSCRDRCAPWPRGSRRSCVPVGRSSWQGSCSTRSKT